MCIIIQKVIKMSVKHTKEEIRSYNLKQIKRHVKISAKCKHYSVLNNLYSLIKHTKSKNILMYMPLEYEVDVYKLRRKLSNKCNIFMPFMVGLSLKMVKSRSPFLIDKFKVRQPVNRQIFKGYLDMAIVPVVGVDLSLGRIGHGKGFYDRFFSELSHRPKIIVFVQMIDLFYNKEITQKHDISCDIYMTPRQNYIKRGKNDRDFCRIGGWCHWRWSRISCS